jgi:chitin disaccharide deacetylase
MRKTGSGKPWARRGSSVSEMHKRLIVNADDFGLSAGVNAGIANAHEQGIVTSASLMVRRAAAGQAGAYARRHRELSVGLHVDMGEWEYRDGAWIIVAEPPESYEHELLRQLEVFRRLVGQDPTHLDSHQHVHREQPLATALAAIARELDVPVRGMDRRIAYEGGFYGQTARGEPMHHAISVKAMLDLLGDLPEGITELGCHPGVASEDLVYGIERSIEQLTLCDPQVHKALEAHGIRLCSFTEMRYLASGSRPRN